MTTSNTVPSDIRDPSLAEAGVRRIEWAAREMPVLGQIRERVSRAQPLRGLRLGACLHGTTETANLLLTLQAGGAQVAVCASNPLSTQDDVAAALVQRYAIPTVAIKGEDAPTYYRHIHAVLATRPQLTLDDGCDLVATLHKEQPAWLGEVWGGTE